jgi:hypothetical protein
MDGGSNEGWINIVDIMVFGRDGTYERTMIPTPQKLAPSPYVRTEGNNRCVHSELRPVGTKGQRRQMMTIAGEQLFFCGMLGKIKPPEGGRVARYLHRLRLDGIPRGDYFGPALPDNTGYQTRPAIGLAVTPDGKTVYVTGLRDTKRLHHAVYRANWSDKEMAPWFGDVETPGKDEGHLNQPRGVALDAKGRVYVCDWGNNRILVLSAGEKKPVARIEVPGPELVCVHPATGAIYVYSVRDKNTWWTKEKSLIKFASVEESTGRLAELPMPWKGRGPGMHGVGPVMTLDASDPREPRLWVSSVEHFDVGGYLGLVADRGGKLERLPTPIPMTGGSCNCAIAVDCAREEVYLGSGSVPGVMRIDGRTGKVERLKKIQNHGDGFRARRPALCTDDEAIQRLGELDPPLRPGRQPRAV